MANYQNKRLLNDKENNIEQIKIEEPLSIPVRRFIVGIINTIICFTIFLIVNFLVGLIFIIKDVVKIFNYLLIDFNNQLNIPSNYNFNYLIDNFKSIIETISNTQITPTQKIEIINIINSSIFWYFIISTITLTIIYLLLADLLKLIFGLRIVNIKKEKKSNLIEKLLSNPVKLFFIAMNIIIFINLTNINWDYLYLTLNIFSVDKIIIILIMALILLLLLFLQKDFWKRYLNLRVIKSKEYPHNKKEWEIIKRR